MPAIIVETNNGRNIACSKITFEVRPRYGLFALLYRDDSDDGEYIYQEIPVTTIEKIYSSKEA